MGAFDFIDTELARIGAVAPAGYFLALRIRGSSPLMAFKTYPPAWIEKYMENGYLLRDPITTWSMTVGGTIRWSSPFLIDPFRILRQAAEHGLIYGASVAHGPLGALSICSAGRSDREMTDAEIALIRDVVVGLHEKTALPTALSEDDKAVLRAMGKGQGPEEAAAGLNLTPATARTRYRQVCDSLFAQNPDEAVQRARDYKLL